jgi:hypothetical protein
MRQKRKSKNFKLLLDTCVWLELAKTTKGEKLLNILFELIESKLVSVIVPDIVISEFQRNKDRIINDHRKSLSAHFDIVKKVISQYGKEEDKRNLLPQLSDLNHKLYGLKETIAESMTLIEAMFITEVERIELTDEIKLRVFDRSLKKEAPFHTSRNSIADAIILESYIDYKLKFKSKNLYMLFVTHNKEDFSLKTNPSEPHEDFKNIFNKTNSRYFISLPEALKAISPNIIEEYELENDWYFEPRGFSEILDVEAELVEKIWYNRHQNRAFYVNNGQTKIIDRKDFDIKNMQDTIVKDIWEGALKAAKGVEQKYGKKNLIWDDFEWGMLNGKLSALRWVMGDDWDMLDT